MSTRMRCWPGVPRVLEVLKHRWCRDVVVSIITLAVGVAALVGADYGVSIWIQIPLYLWLSTLGLPTTLTVLVLASVWGRFEPLYGMGWFKCVSVLLAPVFQVLVMECLRQWRRCRSPAQENLKSSQHGV